MRSLVLILPFLISSVLFFRCANTEKKVPIISTKFSHPKTIEQIESYAITNHLNQKVNLNDFKEKVQLVNFFFTSCTTICPAMEKELLPIVKKYNDEDMVFLSFTIDLENDSVSVLNNFASQTKAITNNRFFLRIEPKALEAIAKLYLSQINTDNDDLFYHTSYAVLLDKKSNIRGLYDLLNSQEVELLEEDIKIILNQKN